MVDSEQDQLSSQSNQAPSLRWVRVTGLILIGLILVWLPFEDTNLRLVYLYAISISTWGAAGFLTKNSITGKKSVMMYALTGIVAGFGVTLLAVFLMVFKNGIHGHPAPDFTIEDILKAGSSFYIWVIAGLLIGLGISLSKISGRI